MSQSQPLRVAVMGAGAVGCYYGAVLAKAGHPVTLIGRPALAEAVAERGLVLDTAQGRDRAGALAGIPEKPPHPNTTKGGPTPCSAVCT